MTLFFIAFFLSASCGWVGAFLQYRRWALMGDGMSHGLLPGIVLTWAILGRKDPVSLTVVSVFLAFFIFRAVQRLSGKEGLRSDSSLAITLVSLFSLGVVLLQTLAHNVDLDLDCVLFGELGLLSLENPWMSLGGLELTLSVVISFFLFLLSAALTWGQQRSYAFLTLDKSNSQIHGLKESRFLRILALWLALVVAHSFEKAGVVLVLGMLTLPAAILHVLGRTWTQMLWLMPPLVAGISYMALVLGRYFDLNLSALWVQSAFVVFMLLAGKTLTKLASK